MLDQFRGGDVVIVTKYDRLARFLKDLLEIVEAIRERGAGFRSLAEDIDTTTSTGRLVFHVVTAHPIYKSLKLHNSFRANFSDKMPHSPLTART